MGLSSASQSQRCAQAPDVADDSCMKWDMLGLESWLLLSSCIAYSCQLLDIVTVSSKSSDESFSPLTILKQTFSYTLVPDRNFIRSLSSSVCFGLTFLTGSDLESHLPHPLQATPNSTCPQHQQPTSHSKEEHPRI